MTIKTHNSIGDLLELPAHVFRKQYDLMVEYYQELKRVQEEEERKARSRAGVSSWARPRPPSIPPSYRFPTK